MNRIILVTACLLLACGRSSTYLAYTIQPANPNATESARKVLNYLHNLPKQVENRLISGHLAGGSTAPHLRNEYQFKMDEINYLHEISGQWIGMIGADYCAGWIESGDPVGDSMYYTDLNSGLIDYWNAGGLVIITTHQFDPRELHKDGGQVNRNLLPEGMNLIDISTLYTPGNEAYDNFR